MKKIGTLKKNFLLNIAYQILVLILPLITVPYVSRVLGASGIGEYSYTYSIVYYFIIVAMLGFNNYGNRTVAHFRHDREKLSKKFAEIYTFQILMSIGMIVLYSLYLLLVESSYKTVGIIQIIYLVACVFDINWFFFGLEEFKLTVPRNIAIKFLSLIAIFVFVRSEDDVWIYTLILSAGTLLSQIILFPFLHRYIDRVKIKLSDLKPHMAPCFGLFLPVVASTIYRTMDKTMIGWFSDMSEVGIYENAEKVITIPTAVITALGTVMLPRLSNMYGADSGDEVSEEAALLMYKSMKFVMFLAFAMMFGLVAISNNFVSMFFGSSFNGAGIVMSFLAITIPLMAWGNVVRTQYLIPKKKDKIYVASAFCAAFINLIVNFLLIPRYAAVGACFGTVIAELVVVFYQTYAVKEKLPIITYLKESAWFLAKAVLMLGTVFVVASVINIDSIYIRLTIQICVGVLVYGILNYNYIRDLLGVSKK